MISYAESRQYCAESRHALIAARLWVAVSASQTGSATRKLGLPFFDNRDTIMVCGVSAMRTETLGYCRECVQKHVCEPVSPVQGQFLAYKAVSYRANLPDNKPLFALKLSKMCEVFGNLLVILKFRFLGCCAPAAWKMLQQYIDII